MLTLPDWTPEYQVHRGTVYAVGKRHRRSFIKREECRRSKWWKRWQPFVPFWIQQGKTVWWQRLPCWKKKQHAFHAGLKLVYADLVSVYPGLVLVCADLCWCSAGPWWIMLISVGLVLIHVGLVLVCADLLLVHAALCKPVLVHTHICWSGLV